MGASGRRKEEHAQTSKKRDLDTEGERQEDERKWNGDI